MSSGVTGQLISKGDFRIFIPPKNKLENVKLALAYWGRNFSFVFWKNWNSQKTLSKLTDL